MKPASKRFSPSGWLERLVPLLLAALAIGLLVTIAIVLLAVLGWLPG
jgi:hypothetical protein